ncbi:MAG: hypothetical protein HQL36_10740, partial [Alphaproteobacteria bacterium]|nr:hypothetical protein [Alphaproteobacteria bacterium]
MPLNRISSLLSRTGALALATASLLLLGVFFQPAHAQTVSASDAKTAKAFYDALDGNRFKDAKRLQHSVQNHELAEVLLWSYISAPRGPSNYDDIAPFLVRHPDWPKRTALLKRAEETLPASMSAKDVLAWLDKNGGPVSTQGRVRQAEAFLALGRKKEAEAAIRDLWVTGSFSQAQEKAFYRKHKNRLTSTDHEARLDRLIWDERYWDAKRQLWKVDNKQRKLALARLLLMQREGDVDRAISDLERTAPELSHHPGLTFERMRWRRRKGRTDEALDVLKSVSGDPLQPDKWWTERVILGRDLLRENKPQKAYAVVSAHALTPKNAAEYSDAEWMAGWIALRFLGDPERAYRHFRHMLDAVSYPISVARGAYWSGRAAQELKRESDAKAHYAQAAQHNTTYYGQLASEQLGPEQG